MKTYLHQVNQKISSFSIFLLQVAGLLGAAAAGGLGVTYALNADLLASGGAATPGQYPWWNNGLFNTLDHARYEQN